MIKFFMKQNTRRSFLIILSLLAFSLFSYYVIKEEKGIKLGIHQKGGSFIEGLKMVHRRNGNSDWVLTAKRADMSEDGGTAHLSGIAMTIEQKGMTVYGDTGIYNMTDRNLSIDGKVVAKGDKYSITSDNGAEFNGAANSVKTNGNVKIESLKFNVEGKTMQTENNGQIVRIVGDVKAVFNH